MTSMRGILVLCLPVTAGLALLVTAVALRGEAAAPRPRPKANATASARKASPSPSVARPPKSAPASVLTSAVDEARIRSTWQNYRTAVATGNGPLRDALGRALARDRDFAVRLAEEEVARAGSERDRAIALAALEGLAPGRVEGLRR